MDRTELNSYLLTVCSISGKYIKYIVGAAHRIMKVYQVGGLALRVIWNVHSAP